MDKEGNAISSKVKKILADFLGVELDDIKPEDLLSEDLHMAPTDLTDFMEKLKSEGVDTSGVELTGDETVEELIESLIDHS